jgi:hypothetical protein
MRCSCLLLLLMVWPLHDANAETRVLFVGNSVSYYHGLPYVFEEVASDLYDLDVHVDTWVQPGGLLSQASSEDNVMVELAADPYDVVVLQEWGSLLMCSRASEANWSDRCRKSLDAHSSIIAAAAGTDAVTILLGTNQMRADATAALDEGERRMQLRANIDAHVPYGRLLLEGQDRFPAIPWLDPDGGHPGPGAVVLMACRIAGEAFDAERGPVSDLEFFEPPRVPDPSPSYQSLMKGTEPFQTHAPSVLSPEQIAEVFEICDE